MAISPDDFPGPRSDFPGGGGTLPVRIITTSLSSGNEGTPYFAYLDALAGYPPYNWGLVTGTLPVGLLIDSSGFISGTPATGSSGTYTFTIQVADDVGAVDTQVLTLEINSAGTPTITTITLPPVIVGNSYNQTVAVTGGTPPYVDWTITNGILPPGLIIDLTGLISGIPTTPGNYSFTVNVEDTAGNIGNQILSILVQSVAPTITTINLLSGTSGVAYSDTIYASGGTTPYTNWQITIGTLPPGLLLSGTPTNASISGTPISAGVYNFTASVTDSAGAVDTQNLSITIIDGTIPTISTTELNFAPTNAAYSETLQASGGSLPYNWSILSGDFPTGLTLNSSTGEISGIPTSNGSYVFTIQLVDATGKIDTQLLSIVVGNFILPSITTDLLPFGTVGSFYSSHVQGSGGRFPYNWGIIGALPSGLTINSLTGEISGTPSISGSYTFNVLLQDGDGLIDVQGFLIEIGDSNSPTILTTTLSVGSLNVDYNQPLSVTGGIPGYTWTKTIGSLPPGLQLSTTGIISGIPTAIGAFNFVVQVKDSANVIDTQSYTLIVTSTGYSSNCCFCVFTSQIVDFTNNSSDGVLTATGGTILSNTQWQAPSLPGIYDIIITSDSINGTIQVVNTITVVQELKLVDTPEVINYLLPGDSMSLKTNYPVQDVVWETLDCEVPIVTPNGFLKINTNVADKCFGSLNCTIRANLIIQGICSTLESHVDIKIIVNPVYPTPDHCGPDIIKWLRETKDFRVLITEFEGGCDETHIRNKVPIVRWTINYDGLPNYLNKDTTCPNCTKCATICGCNDLSQMNALSGCHPILKSSNRLDDFWNLVYGQYKSFTLVDHDTQEIWYNVRFDDKMSTDHRHRRTSGSRNVKLVWKPCCSSAPAGGTCSKHGVFNYVPVRRPSCISGVPGIPIIISVENSCNSSIVITWNKSCTEIGIAKYQIKVNDSQIIDVLGDSNTASELFNLNLIHSFSVRAVDIAGTYSEWSPTVKSSISQGNYIYVTENGISITENGSCVIDTPPVVEIPCGYLQYNGDQLIYNGDTLLYSCDQLCEDVTFEGDFLIFNGDQINLNCNGESSPLLFDEDTMTFEGDDISF